MNDAMTQQEIDEMIRLAAQHNSETDHQDAPAVLSSLEIDALGEISNISMGAAATALHAILSRKVVITTPDVSVTTMDKISDKQVVPFVMVDVEYAEGFVGHNLFILKLDDVKVITDIMLGGEGVAQPGELSELHLSAISEAMNQMMGGVATAMAEMFSMPVNISPPRTKTVLLSDRQVHDMINDEESQLIRARFRLEIEDLLNSDMMQLMPVKFGRQLVEHLLKPASASVTSIKQADQIQVSAGRKESGIPAGRSTQQTSSDPVQPARPSQTSSPEQTPQLKTSPQEPVSIQPVRLTSFDQQLGELSALNENGIDLILDVPLQITVELGQCRRSIKDILDLNIGSIVELDRLAGEPVDVVVNGKTVAKGEVIVIDENYGIRITEVLSSQRKTRVAQ